MILWSIVIVRVTLYPAHFPLLQFVPLHLYLLLSNLYKIEMAKEKNMSFLLQMICSLLFLYKDGIAAILLSLAIILSRSTISFFEGGVCACVCILSEHYMMSVANWQIRNVSLMLCYDNMRNLNSESVKEKH